MHCGSVFFFLSIASISATGSSEAISATQPSANPSHRLRSAVATPYNLIPGDGQRYLLSMVQAIQRLGHIVDIIVDKENVCGVQSCVARTATELRVGVDWTVSCSHAPNLSK